jgi:hypothetical protein
MAEASSTLLLIFGGLSTFGYEVISQRCIRRQILLSSPLCALNAVLLCREAEHIVIPFKDNFAAGFNT